VDDTAGARKAFAHNAVVVMRQGDNSAALGGVIATALCGGWDHQPLAKATTG
jgi:hypothetical protein